jgi:hypothetical protein
MSRGQTTWAVVPARVGCGAGPQAASEEPGSLMRTTGSARIGSSVRRKGVSVVEDKCCASCGRTFSWRRAWARDWAQVRFCSDACRRHKVRAVDRDLETAIVRLLEASRAGATICPSEVARAVAGDDRAEWEPLMEPARRAARRLVAAGEVELVQRGRVVDRSAFRGPVRIRRVR